MILTHSHKMVHLLMPMLTAMIQQLLQYQECKLAVIYFQVSYSTISLQVIVLTKRVVRWIYSQQFCHM